MASLKQANSVVTGELSELVISAWRLMPANSQSSTQASPEMNLISTVWEFGPAT